jgi:hypothetical protein
VTATTEFDDVPVSVDDVLAGAWWPSRYGAGDERGTLNEVTPEKTAAALRLLDLSRPVKTYTLSETLFNGFPAYGDRAYEQRLVLNGFAPPAGYEGIVQSPEPIGPYLLSSLEERVQLTYNMGTKINGLHHVGIGGRFYNGLAGADISRSWGTTHCGMESQGPVVTRGVLIDVIGEKVDRGRTDDFVVLPTGRATLVENYRITMDDIDRALARQRLPDPGGPGDVILVRTGWRNHLEVDPARYLSTAVPGLGLREIRYLASRRPAILGMDVWFFGARGQDDPAAAILGHQEAAVRYGVRIGEAVPTDVLAADGVFEFVFILSPNNARGAVSANTPPLALAQP